MNIFTTWGLLAFVFARLCPVVESVTNTLTTSCKGRAEQITGLWESFRQVGMKCRLELGSGADECNLYVRVQEDIAIGEEICFVPESLLLQPYVASSSEGDDARLLATALKTAFTTHGVCDSRSALAVRLIQEGQRRCDCSSHQYVGQSEAKCSMWTCLLPETFNSALEFTKVSRQLLNGSSARGPLVGLQAQYDKVHMCLEKLDFFPSALTDQEIAWGFHAARTRGSGRDKEHSLINPITVMFNYHPNISMAQVFAFRDTGPSIGEVMRAQFDLKLGDEIFYKYGEFTNAELLVLYGFVVPESLAKEADVPAIRVYTDGLTVQSDHHAQDMGEHKQWHAQVRNFFNKLKCNTHLILAFRHDGQLRWQHSRLFPACAALHYLSTFGATPENPETQQIFSSEGAISPRIRDWPPALAEGDVSVWHALVVHQWTLLAEICGKELQRLESTVAATGLILDVAAGTLQLDSATVWEEDQQTKEGVTQLLTTEAMAYALCKKHAHEIAANPLLSSHTKQADQAEL